MLTDFESTEKELEQKRRERIYKEMNIPLMYYDEALESFSAETEEQKKALELAKKIVTGEIKKLVMLGKNGVGKTHLAIGCLKKSGGKIYTVYEITVRIRATYSPRATETEKDIIDELSSVPLLILDEIGRTNGSESEMRWLSAIIDKRHSELLPIILISNKHTKIKCSSGGCVDCIENYISADVMSRLQENGKVINMSGEDYRRKK